MNMAGKSYNKILKLNEKIQKYAPIKVALALVAAGLIAFSGSARAQGTFTSQMNFMANSNVFTWNVEYGACTCPTKTRPAIITCRDSSNAVVADSFCAVARPDDTPQDCASAAEVNNCFGWFTPNWGACPCGQTTSRTSTCNERNTNAGSLTSTAAADGTLSCSREGDTEPNPNPETRFCGACPETAPGPAPGPAPAPGPDQDPDQVWLDTLDMLSDSGVDVVGLMTISGLDDFSINSQMAFMQNLGSVGGADPLAFDLNGDGKIELTAINEGTMFDMDNDGIADATAWINPDDGLLFLDENGDGKVTNQSELFGRDDMLAYEELALHDENGDGKIDINDSVYTDLQIWQDKNSNGISEEGEMKSLAYWNVTEIGLGHEEVEEEKAGNKVTGFGQFKRVLGGAIEYTGKVMEFFFDFFGSKQ